MHSEMWGLAVVPDGDLFVTVSEDATLRIWNIKTRKQEKLIILCDEAKYLERAKEGALPDIPENAKARVVDVSADGTQAIVGFKDGSIRLIALGDGTSQRTKVEFTSCVSVIKISQMVHM